MSEPGSDLSDLSPGLNSTGDPEYHPDDKGGTNFLLNIQHWNIVFF